MTIIPQFLKSQPVPEMRPTVYFQEPELPDSLADEAMSVCGFHDAMRAQSLTELRQLRDRLVDNIDRETEALAEVDAMIAREEYAEAHAVPKLASPSPKPDKPKKTRAGEAKAG